MKRLKKWFKALIVALVVAFIISKDILGINTSVKNYIEEGVNHIMGIERTNTGVQSGTPDLINEPSDSINRTPDLDPSDSINSEEEKAIIVPRPRRKINQILDEIIENLELEIEKVDT